MEDSMIKNIDELPDRKGTVYSERLTVCISRDTRRKLDYLKSRGKDVRKIVRSVIDNFLEQINFDDAS